MSDSSPPSTSSSTPPVHTQDDDDDANNNNASNNDLLLSDVNAALSRIVSSVDDDAHEAKRRGSNSPGDDSGSSRIPKNNARVTRSSSTDYHTNNTRNNTRNDTSLNSEDDDSDDGTSSVVLTLSEPQLTALRKLHLRVSRQSARSKQTLRKVVTGDPRVRVRDHAKTRVQQTSATVQQQVRRVVTGSSQRSLSVWASSKPVVKTMDKFSFCWGVFVLLATEYVALQEPAQFGRYFCVLVAVMMALRVYMYQRTRYLYFLLDFCYWANAACFVSVLYLPENDRLWRLNFVAGNGALLGALLAWRNSLVFHSLDKVTSIAIHFLPGLLTYLHRWSDTPDEALAPGLGWQGALWDPLAFYIVWQVLYIVQTEVVDRERMRSDPSLQTSLRWLTRDARNPMHKIAKRICRATGLLHATEDFCPDSLKTKLVFWTSQLIFHLVTLLPVPWLFSYRILHTLYLLMVLSAAVFNGSNYYFEVFAARYLQQLDARQQRPKEQTHSDTVDQAETPAGGDTLGHETSVKED